MANFGANSSSQYIAKKIIRPDFLRTPGHIVIFVMMNIYVRFW
jgi:hypothetical protein